MHEDKIEEYRAQAADCKARAELESDKTVSARWLKVAEEWFRMADNLERRLYPNKSFPSNHKRNL
jgi:hypothetical protein